MNERIEAWPGIATWPVAAAAAAAEYVNWEPAALAAEIALTEAALANWEDGRCGVREARVRQVGVRALRRRLAALESALARGGALVAS